MRKFTRSALRAERSGFESEVGNASGMSSVIGFERRAWVAGASKSDG